MLKRNFTALIILALVLALIRIELLYLLDTHVLGSASHDGGLYLWLVQVNLSNFQQLIAGKLAWFSLFESNAFYPYGLSILYSDNFLLPSLLVAALCFLGCSQIAAYNITLLSACLLSGYLTYLMCLKLGAKRRAALISSSALLIAHPFTAQLGHPQLQFFFFIPLSVMLTWRCIISSSFSSAFLLGLTICAALYTTVYYAAFAIIAACIVFIFNMSKLNLKRILSILICGLIGILPASFVIVGYFQIAKTFSARGIYEPLSFSASGLSYISSAPTSFIYSWLSELSHPEADLFIGIALIILACISVKFPKMLMINLVCLVIISSSIYLLAEHYLTPYFFGLAMLLSWTAVLLAYRYMHSDKTIKGSIIAITIITFIISLGPLVPPEPKSYQWSFFRLLYEFIPGFEALRAISRIGLLTIWGMITLSSITLSNMRSLMLAPLAFIIAIENYTPRYALDSPSAVPALLRQQSESLESNLKDGAIIILPYSGALNSNNTIKSWKDFAGLNVNAMQWSATLGLKCVNGYSGQITKLMRELPAKLKDFPNQRAITALSEIAGLKYIYIDAEINPKLIADPALTLIAHDSSGALLKLNPFLILSNEREIILPKSTRDLSFIAHSQSNRIKLVIRNTSSSSVQELSGHNGKFSIRIPKSSDSIRPIRINISSPDPSTSLSSIEIS